MSKDSSDDRWWSLVSADSSTCGAHCCRIRIQDDFKRCCDWSNKWDFVTVVGRAGRYLTQPYVSHFSSGSWQKRKSLRSYTASTKPDFTAERSAVSGGSAPSEWYYSGHQGAASSTSLHPQVPLQDNVVHREAPWLLSCSSLISGHKYLTTHTQAACDSPDPTQHWRLTLRCVNVCLLHRTRKLFLAFDLKRTLFDVVKTLFRKGPYSTGLKCSYFINPNVTAKEHLGSGPLGAAR